MKVLFICCGNINRSPAAEIILNSYNNGHVAKSCGTGKTALAKVKMAKRTREVLKEIGLSGESHNSQPLTEELLNWAEVVICMAPVYRKKVESQWPQYLSKVEVWTIKDPHFSKGTEIHREVVSQIRYKIEERFHP